MSRLFEEGFLIWTHDPCREGGWHIQSHAMTFEEAKKRAEENHQRELENFERVKESGLEHRPEILICYDTTMVTSAALFKIKLPGVKEDPGHDPLVKPIS